MVCSSEAQTWLDEYESIYADYLAQVEASGVKLTEYGSGEQEKC